MKYNKEVIEGTYYFIKLVELGSYTAIRNECNIEINTIKSQIAVLEVYLGNKITKKLNNKISPTAYGSRYYSSCVHSYKSLENSTNRFLQDDDKRSKAISFYGTPLFNRLAMEIVLPHMNMQGKNFNFKNCYEWNVEGSKHLLDSYDVIQLRGEQIQHLDLQEWVPCIDVKGRHIDAFIYGRKDSFMDLHSNTNLVSKMPVVMSRYDIDYNIHNILSQNKS